MFRGSVVGYDPNNFGDGSPINQALSAAHAALWDCSCSDCVFGLCPQGLEVCAYGILGLLSMTFAGCIRRRLRFLLRLRWFTWLYGGMDSGSSDP